MFCIHSFSVFFSLCLFYLQLLFLNTCQKVINGLVDKMTATVFRQSYMTQRLSLFTPTSYSAIVFSLAPQFSLMVGLLHAMAFMVLLLIG